MSRTILNILVVTTACMSWYSGFGSALKIDITPNKAHRLVHHEVDIYCKLEESDMDIKEVIILELAKEDAPIAVIRQNLRLTTGRSLKSKFKAEGRISTSPLDSYLHVTLSNPDIDDSGPYTCLFYFKGDMTLVKESRRSVNLTVYGSALNIDITPNKANGLVQHEVNIHCNMEYSGKDVTQIKMMELTRDGEPIAVIHNNSKITMGKDTESTFKAEGKLSAPPMESYLHLTLSNPDAKDSGRYTCLVYYVDEVMSRVKESSKSDNLTVVDHDVESALTFLLDKISRLKEIHAFDMALLNKELDKERSESMTNQDLIAGFEAALKTQKSVHESDVFQMKKGIERQMNDLKEEKVLISSLTTALDLKRSTHEIDFFELKNDLEKQVNKSLSHQALISELKTQLKEKKRAHQIDFIRLKKELIRKEDGMRADQSAVSNLKEEVDAFKEGHHNDAVQLRREISQQMGKTLYNEGQIYSLKFVLRAKIEGVNDDVDVLDVDLDRQGNILTDKEKTLRDSISQLAGRVTGNDKDSLEQELMLHNFKTRESTTKNILLQLDQGKNSRSQRITEVFYKEKQPVLFRALKYENQNYTEDGTMLFPEVMSNEGKCYNAASGVFTAPVTGYYRLSVSVAANDYQYIYMDLRSSNGQTLTTLYDGEKLGWMEYSETSVVTKLEAGEEVRAVMRELTPTFNVRFEDYHDAMKKFNGYLLKPL